MARRSLYTQISDRAAHSTGAYCRNEEFATAANGSCTIDCKLSARIYAAALLIMAITIAGCGGTTAPVIVNPSGGPATMPTPPAPGAVNTYNGTDSQSIWSIHLDDTQNTFSYSGGIAGVTKAGGSFQASNGFLNLGNSNGSSLGYALEVQGRMALLRPGDTSAPLVVAVPQTSCYSIPYRLRFGYVPMEAAPGNATFTSSNYGSFVLNTDTAGANWQFQGLEGTPVSGPTSFNATCSASNSADPLSISTPTLLSLDNNGSSLFTYVGGNTDVIDTALTLGPSGIMVAYQTDSSFTFRHISAGSVGVVEPVAPLSPGDIASGSYLGFLTQAAQDDQGNGTYLAPGSTSPVSFSTSSLSPTALAGGTFPNDNIGAAPNTDVSITFGSQSSTINGLYASASITMSDPNQNCTTALVLNPKLKIVPGQDVNGYPICTFPAVAVVGNPEGKYVIFIDSFNYTANSIVTEIGAPMQIYLYQQ